jgi:hypothetical protein
VKQGVCNFCGYRDPASRKPDIPRHSGLGVTEIAGLDLGQLQDHTALVLMHKRAGPKGSIYQVTWMHRFPLGTAYPTICNTVSAWLTRPTWLRAPVVVDQTGVGVAVVDMLRGSPIAGRVVPITITAGQAITVGAKENLVLEHYRVAKIQLVGVLQALLGTGRLQIAAACPHAVDLTKELKHFKAKVTASGNESFEAWRERDHDDLVLGLALACWYGERGQPAKVLTVNHA